MAKNTGNGSRIGIIKERIQWFNPKTERFVCYNTHTKKIISNSKNKYKGIVCVNKDKIPEGFL